MGRNRDGDADSGGYSGGWRKDTRDITYADADGLETVDDWRCVDGCAVRALAEQSGVSKSTGGVKGGHLGDRIYSGGWQDMERANAGGLGDTGTAARFFPNFEPSPLDTLDAPWLYTAKASRREREAGLKGMEERRKPGMNASVREYDGNKHDAVSLRNHHPTVKSLALMRWLVRLVTPPGGIVLDPFLGSGTTGMAAAMEGFSFVGVEQDAEYIEIARRRIAWAQEQQPPLLRATKAVASSEWRVASEEEEATETVERGA